MKYPRLGAVGESRQTVDIFKGYQHRLRVSDGAFYEMQDLTADHYPLLSPRPPRGIYDPTPAVQLLSCDAVVAGTVEQTLCALVQTDAGLRLRIGDTDSGLSLSDGDKQLVAMGAYVIVFPDKQYVNTLDRTTGALEAVWQSEDTVSFTLCDRTGTPYELVSGGKLPPENPENGDCWMDLAGKEPVLKCYSADLAQWIEIADTYVKMESPGIGKQFQKLDGVVISGIDGAIATGFEADRLNGTAVIVEKDRDYIMVEGLILWKATQDPQEGQITVRRAVPDMDFVIPCGNRLWGCKYGIVDGVPVNEIYGCKLGDFKNWNSFQGTAADSWVASVGTDGPFTGAVAYRGSPLFFKEDCLHKVYISATGAHQLTDTVCTGVQQGFGGSLATVGGVLYYKSAGAMMAYDGSQPVPMGQDLAAEDLHSHAAAGVLGSKYYLSVCRRDGTPHLLVYDTEKGLWHRESGPLFQSLCPVGETLYGASAVGIFQLAGSITAPEETPVRWSAVTGVLGLEDPGKKYISRLILRLQLQPGSQVAVDIAYDGSPVWQQVCRLQGTGLGAVPITVRPRRCDHLRLRLQGEGPAKVYSLTKILTRGSERA